MKYSFLGILLFLLISGLNAQTSEYVGLKMEVIELREDTIRATLITDHFVNMIAFEFNLNWNPADLEFIDLDYTNRDIGLLPDFFNLDNAGQGRVRVIWSTAGCETLVQGDSLFSFLLLKKSTDFVIVPPADQMLFYDCDGNELRMEYIDNQGEKTHFPSGATALDFFSPHSMELTVFPNPCTDFFHLDFSQKLSGKLKIYDGSGKLVGSMNLFDTNSATVNVSHLASGQYFLEILSGKEQIRGSVFVR